MTQKFTLHTHTWGFDGQNTPAEMIARARQLGFDCIGISNHFIVHPKICHSKMYKYASASGYASIYSASFSDALQKFEPHYRELTRLQSENPDIRLLRGLEVDFSTPPNGTMVLRVPMNCCAQIISLGRRILLNTMVMYVMSMIWRLLILRRVIKC